MPQTDSLVGILSCEFDLLGPYSSVTSSTEPCESDVCVGRYGRQMPIKDKMQIGSQLSAHALEKLKETFNHFDPQGDGQSCSLHFNNCRSQR